ncbi:MAG: hypothetical protein WBB67_09770 [bacterium]
MKLPGSAAHDKYMFFSILYIVGIVFVFAIIIPNIARNQPVMTKTLIWIISIIFMLGIAIFCITYIERNKNVKKHKKSNGLRLIGGISILGGASLTLGFLAMSTSGNVSLFFILHALSGIALLLAGMSALFLRKFSLYAYICSFFMSFIRNLPMLFDTNESRGLTVFIALVFGLVSISTLISIIGIIISYFDRKKCSASDGT